MKQPKPKASASVGVKATLRPVIGPTVAFKKTLLPISNKKKKTPFGSNSSKGTTRK